MRGKRLSLWTALLSRKRSRLLTSTSIPCASVLPFASRAQSSCSHSSTDREGEKGGQRDREDSIYISKKICFFFNASYGACFSAASMRDTFVALSIRDSVAGMLHPTDEPVNA